MINVKLVLKEIRKNLLAKKNVVAVGIGYKQIAGKKTNIISIVCSVIEKVSLSELSKKDKVPEKVKGIRTDVIETGIIKALKSRTDRWRPCPGGCSISHEEITAGTLGCLVKRNGELFILSNNHVMANCFDERTEVLTKQGWTRWEDVTMNSLFATRDEDGSLKYQFPKELFKKYYVGKMVELKGMWHDLLVTPNHRLLSKKTYFSGTAKHMLGRNDFKDFYFMDTRDALRRFEETKTGSIQHTCKMKWNCNSKMKTIQIAEKIVPIESYLEFLGLYLSDGSTTIRKKLCQYIVQIRTTKKKIKERVKALTELMGYHSFENGDAIRITNKNLALHLKPLGKTKTKRIPRKFLTLPPSKLKHLWKGLVDGDGHFVKEKGYYIFTLANKGLVDDIQEIALKLGMGASVREKRGSSFNPDGIYFTVTTHRTEFKQYHKPKIKNYAGKIYCANVPNGTLLVRRNGHPIWTGNSNMASIGDQILQPGSYNGGKLTQDMIARLTDFVPIEFISQEGCTGQFLKLFRRKQLENLVDAAIAKPIEDSMVSKKILDIGFINGLNIIPKLGMKIQKSGRTTAVTKDEILQLDVTVQVQYGEGKIALFTDQIMAGEMCSGGDSGSVVLDEDNHLVGLLFAGSDNSTVINRIAHVFKELNLSLL